MELNQKTCTQLDLLRFTIAVEKRWGIKAVQIHIHKDEGHYKDIDEFESWEPNLHAHIVWDWMDHATGKSRKLSEKDMSEMQDLLAEELNMQRGQSKQLSAGPIDWKTRYSVNRLGLTNRRPQSAKY